MIKMSKKFYVSNLEELNEYEREHNKISYARLCDRVFSDMILCNNIAEVDEAIFDNVITGNLYDYVDDDGNYYTQEEFEQDEAGKIYEQCKDIYQWYIVNIAMSEEYIQKHFGDEFILTYSDVLDCYILGVDHFGTGWDYVLTDLEPTTDYKAI